MAKIRRDKSIFGKKLQAFSLFESVVAIAIISVLIGIGTLVYSNLIEAEKPIPYYQAKEKIEVYYHDLQENKAFFPKIFEQETYTIEQKVDYHRGNKKIYLVEYVVTAQNKTWYSEKHLLTNPYVAQ